MLKMSLQEIRGQIQMYPENWKNIYTTNCYAYALGLDLPEDNICKSAYQPGTISGSSNLCDLSHSFYFKELVYGVEEDLKTLNISFRQINPKDIIEENEWKIALYVEIYLEQKKDFLCKDFHFLRTNKNGAWIHKNGWSTSPNKLDDMANKIIDLETCDFFLYQYKKCYALKLNR